MSNSSSDTEPMTAVSTVQHIESFRSGTLPPKRTSAFEPTPGHTPTPFFGQRVTTSSKVPPPQSVPVEKLFDDISALPTGANAAAVPPAVVAPTAIPEKTPDTPAKRPRSTNVSAPAPKRAAPVPTISEHVPSTMVLNDEIANALVFVALNWTEDQIRAKIRPVYRQEVLYVHKNRGLCKDDSPNVPEAVLAHICVPSLAGPMKQYEAWAAAGFTGPEPVCDNWDVFKDMMVETGSVLAYFRWRKPFPPQWTRVCDSSDNSEMQSQLDHQWKKK